MHEICPTTSVFFWNTNISWEESVRALEQNCSVDSFISWIVVMAEYDPRPELMATQQSLLKEYKCQLNKEIGENVILSCLSQWEQGGEKVPHREIQQALKREK